ncbi:transposase [Helcococcus ovis]|nr:transposase [Helcococcus ovis]TFF65748.1 DDE transposase [Helcococcus ovis]
MKSKNNIPCLNFNLNHGQIQVKMDFNTDVVVENDAKLMVLQNLVKELNLDLIKNAYSQKGRKPVIDPISMFQILIYCYSEAIKSSREIEKMCKYDLRILYLLQGQKSPDHSTINRFRQKLEPFVEKILEKNNKFLIDNKLLDASSIYIDGTKIEANANKYTFVWKKAVIKFKDKLIKKVIKYFNLDETIEENSLIKFLENENKKLSKKIESENIVIVHGKGKRKTDTQKKFELIDQYLTKFLEYNKHLEIIGERNSYSKTDHDATFMRMKDDHMLNGQLKPAYNIQFATSGNFILGIYGSHHPSDMYTLPLLINKLYPIYKNKMDKIVCDAGYESEENYVFLDEKKLRAFIKPSNYEISKIRKYKKKQEFRENLIYDKDLDQYKTEEGKIFLRIKDRKKVKKSGYISISKVYKCFDWNLNGTKTKSIWFTEIFEKYRLKSLENITSNEGINERVNRSVQAEGAFSKLKEGLKYSRFKHKGLKNILSEMNLMAIAMNLNTLTYKILNKDFNPTRYISVEEKVA